MSSMLRNTALGFLCLGAIAASPPACAQSGNEWDQARADLVASQPGPLAPAIDRWEVLVNDPRLTFLDYAGFLLTYSDFPNTDRLRGYAEARLSEEFIPPERILAFFDRFPPVTNQAKAHYALSLMGPRPDDARNWALEAWRGGEMAETAEATIMAQYWPQITQADHDARMDALLWQRDREAAERQLPRTSPERREVFRARLAILQGGDGATPDLTSLSDPGYLYNRSREFRLEYGASQAAALATSHPPLASIPFDQTAWVEEMLAVARSGNARQAEQIASRIDEAFAPDTDISAQTYKLRDDYTSLVWLGGTRALWDLGDARAAAPLFYRYGNAARTAPTRSKGFFWAGHAASQAGDREAATRYYEMAAQYPDRFYGQLALTRLGRNLPDFAQGPTGQPTPEERQAFSNATLTQAVTEVARDAPWSTGIRFYREIADQADTIGEHLLVAELAREIGRRDLAVNLADAAIADGHDGFTRIGFPTMIPPQGTDWTLVHAISRQESQFAQNAISHAGARGLMQLMPGTAREEAQKAGIQYLSASLIEDAGYNVRLGSNHIQRLLARYNGSYPLAIAAYNAGPGNVNKWLRQNGDPRTGSVSWIDWIEQIPFYETKTYVTRVLENAVVYEALFPEQATYGRSREIEDFLR